MTAKYCLTMDAPAVAIFQRRSNLQPRILVVEDDPLLRRLNVGLLTDSGYQVDAAEDGAVAWEALQQNPYELLVTDYDMPKVSGVGLLKKLQAARMTLPVIMASGYLSDAELNPYTWLQPAATLLKPYAAEKLLAAVKRVLHAAGNRCGGFRASVICPPPAGGKRFAVTTAPMIECGKLPADGALD